MTQKKDMRLAILKKTNLVQLWEGIPSIIIPIQESTIQNGALSDVRISMTQLDISPRKDSSSQTEEMSPEHATPAMPIQVRGCITCLGCLLGCWDLYYSYDINTNIYKTIVKLRQGSARDGSQGERPQSLKPCQELTLKLVATHPPTHPPTQKFNFS